MAAKRGSAKRGSAKWDKPRVAPAVPLRACAHPRLVHGFVVNPGTRRPPLPDASVPGLSGLAAIFAQAAPKDAPAREGATDGATIH